jgi:transcriptional regulator with XRE-family HTH domain
MEEKQLSSRDVEARSQGKIADAYVLKIKKGITTNPTVSKLQALAVGLGVSEDEIFKIARGLPGKVPQGEPWPGPVLVNAMDRIVANTELTQIVKALLETKQAKIKAVKKLLDIE